MSAPLVLVGGGLANGLIALRLTQVRPEIDVLMIERDADVGGRHTWSFHHADLTAAQHAWIAPIVAHRWPAQTVRFPGHTRRLASPYYSVTSESLAAVVRECLGTRLRTGVTAVSVSNQDVRTGDGNSIAARVVIDGRGVTSAAHMQLAFQKFLGLIVHLDEPHRLDGPLLMDATVDQLDGFRFLYTLPFGERSLLIEDTRYSDTPGVDREAFRAAIREYARQQGWAVAAVENEEHGSLPIVLDGDIEAWWDADGPGVARSGMRAALFHQTTGYSLPHAVRLADAIADCTSLSGQALYDLTRSHSRRAWKTGGFFRMLNRMLFRAARPDQRYRVLERFYRLPEPLIERFYAGRLTFTDKIRILSGRPPVPLGPALGAILYPAGSGPAGPSRGPENR